MNLIKSAWAGLGETGRIVLMILFFALLTVFVLVGVNFGGVATWMGMN